MRIRYWNQSRIYIRNLNLLISPFIDKVKIGDFLDKAICEGWIMGRFSLSDESVPDPKFEAI